MSIRPDVHARFQQIVARADAANARGLEEIRNGPPVRGAQPQLPQRRRPKTLEPTVDIEPSPSVWDDA